MINCCKLSSDIPLMAWNLNNVDVNLYLLFVLLFMSFTRNLGNTDSKNTSTVFPFAGKLINVPEYLYPVTSNTVYVKSHHTNKQVIFKPIKHYHKDFDQDQWDGEQQIYEPMDAGVNVKTLVIYRSE